MKTYQWGILSTANIGRKAMIPALLESSMAEVLAVASRDEEKAKNFADELDIPRAYGDYQALLADPAIDAVYIPLPNHLHREWAVRAAEAGKHVLCEKPLALDPSECRQMIAAAEANKVQLTEAFMYRYHPRILASREMIHSGAIGKVRTIESAFTFRLSDLNNIRYQPEMGGGALMDVGCYCINVSRLLAGREPVTAQARAYWAPTGVDAQLAGMLDFGDGLLAHFDCGLNQARRERCLVAGTEGYLTLPKTFIPGPDEAVIYEEKGREISEQHTFADVNHYRLLAEDFMHTIDGSVPLFPIEDAVDNMRVIVALLASARDDGRVVSLSRDSV